MVAFNDAAGVAEAVEYLHTHPTQRREMGRRAHLAALEHFDWNRSGPEFVDVIEGFAATA